LTPFGVVRTSNRFSNCRMATHLHSLDATTGHIALSREAICYAIGQLALRAGVLAKLFSTWRVGFDEAGDVVLFVGPGQTKCIRFRSIGESAYENIKAGRFHTTTASWPKGIDNIRGVSSDLKIPFSSSDKAHIGELFASDGAGSFRCDVDLPLSVLFTLCRFEETFRSQLDVHGRFPATASIAWRDGFLDRPVVDECGLAFQAVLQHLLPRWQPERSELRVKLSHDVDEIGIPFSLRSAAAKTLKSHRPDYTVRDLVSSTLHTETSGIVGIKRLVRFSADRKLDSAVYWKSSRRSPHDTGYSLRDELLRNLIQSLSQRGLELGIHPSYETFRNPELLKAEAQSVRHALGRYKIGGRQDYLRWCPESWVHWESAALSYDSSVGFADHIGFRAGTCVPYRPWLWSERRVADLVEIPLLIIDSALRGYMKAGPENALALMQTLVDRCRVVGGVFTIAWHNTTLLDRGYTNVYRRLLDELRDCERYNWEAEAA
jgi:hypothetical protein